MSKNELIIIGAGAAGMMAAMAAARNGISVLIIEKMEKAGRKIRITGKGRCNITNTKPWQDFSSHIYPKSNFLKPSFYNFSNIDTINFFEEIGVETIVERGDRVYPKSGMAKEVVDTLVNYLLSLGVSFEFNSKVTDIHVSDGKIESVHWIKDGKKYFEKPMAVILATGGLSYPSTGSDGDGHMLAKSIGLNVTECWPSLTAILPRNYNKSLEGLLLKNVQIELYTSGNMTQSESGDIEFTNNGLEGPIGFKISRKAVKAINNREKVAVVIDLKPALTIIQLTNRINRELEEKKSLTFRGLSSLLFPKQLIMPFIASNNINADAIVNIRDINTISKFVKDIKSWKLDIDGYTSYERAVITAGGVSLDEIVAKKMASRKFENLFFAGEVIDLDADTGGYNLQIAFSTGFMAGKEASYLIQKSK